MILNQLELEIPGKLTAKQRARSTRSGHIYTPKGTVLAEAYIREVFANAFPVHVPYSGPVAIVIYCYRIPPVSWPKWKRSACLVENPGTAGSRENPGGGLYIDDCGSDLDNRVKTILDGLNHVAFRDDRQIFSLVAKKCFDAEKDYTYIQICEYKQAINPGTVKSRVENPGTAGSRANPGTAENPGTVGSRGRSRGEYERERNLFNRSSQAIRQSGGVYGQKAE